MDEGSNIIRWHIYFSGGVQGVGFRYTACLDARELGLTGWVRNLKDGRVEMEAQGPEKDLQDLLRQLRNTPPIRIDDYSIQEIPLKEQEKKFSIAGIPFI